MNMYERFRNEARDFVFFGNIISDAIPGLSEGFKEFWGGALHALKHPENETDWRFAFVWLVLPIAALVIMGVVSIGVLWIVPFPLNLPAVLVWCTWWSIQVGISHPLFGGKYLDAWIEQGREQTPTLSRAITEPWQVGLTDSEIEIQIEARGLVELATDRCWSIDDLWNMYELSRPKFSIAERQHMYKVTAAAAAILWKVGE